jgi:hypothetical protein
VVAGAAWPAAERWQSLEPVQPANKGCARTIGGVNFPRGTTGAACRCRRTLDERKLGAANAGMGKPRWRRSAELNARCQRRRLTFELRGRSRHGAWPARRMMTQDASRAKCHAGGGPWLERRVRLHSLCGSLELTRAACSGVWTYCTDLNAVSRQCAAVSGADFRASERCGMSPNWRKQSSPRVAASTA